MTDEGVEVDSPEAQEAEPAAVGAGTGSSLRNLSPVRLAIIVGVVAALAVGGLCGWLGYQAYQARQDAHLRALLLQVGKQGALNLTTVGYQHVDEDVKRIIDGATGEFYDEFSKRSGPFTDLIKKAQSTSVGTITAAGLESVDGDEGQVMVALSVKASTKGEQGDQPPRPWRMRLNVQRFGDEAKVSKVEFVP